LQLSLGRERNELLALTGEKRINIHEEGSDAPLDARGESRFKFVFSAGFNDEELALSALAAIWTSLVSDSALGFVGFTSRAITDRFGTNSCSNSKRFANGRFARKLTLSGFPQVG
jgi:hypothetical protein